LSDSSIDAGREETLMTEDASNISTEHQPVGDAKRPKDTLNRDREPEGGKAQESVEDRPNVGTTKPEDYPKDQPDH
jgi:hypothetical protein